MAFKNEGWVWMDLLSLTQAQAEGAAALLKAKRFVVEVSEGPDGSFTCSVRQPRKSKGVTVGEVAGPALPEHVKRAFRYVD